ncbi:hypothetical protein DEU56DRAFT_731794, partial [Suillus clintonianus]|uniref:uncharacterized protein n=1 Tax=Suillus clintonianus TaxID=1904413 RepID=UPI001B880226
AGWEPLTHPSGALFFYHPYKRVFTDADVRDPETAAKMGKAAEKAHKEAYDAGIALHPSVELSLEVMLGDGRTIGYYFVDHDRRVIFWFEAHKCIHLMLGVRGVERKSHVRYALESEYWGHVNLFPNKRRLPEDVVVRLKELLMHAQAEYIDLGTSLSPFASEQVESLLGLIDPLMSESFTLDAWNDSVSSGLVWSAPRFLIKLLGIVKFLNFCGQPSARRNTNKSLYQDSDEHSNTILSRVMNLIMFGSPDAHRKVLHWILVDKKIIQLGRYRNFTDRLNSEWNGYAIFSTVLLAVDISFLAVPFVQTQTSAILVSYLSTLCAMGSFVVTLVFARQLNDGRRYPAERVASFMFGVKSSVERLSLMLSLPFAFLIWG